MQERTEVDVRKSAEASAPAIPAPPESGTPPLVELTRVTRRYGRLVALRDVDLTVAPGEFVFVVGPSEAGKSTLLKMIHGDLRPNEGTARVADFRLDRRWRRFLPRLRREVGVVFQDHRMLSDMTARGNVAFALQVANLRVPHAQVRARAQARLEEVGLGRRPNAHPDELSGGQQRRLAIARAVVNDPPLLLADEPTANLDRRNAETVIQLLEQRCQAGAAVIVATHDLELTRTRPYRVVELRSGRVVADRPARVATAPAPMPAGWARRIRPKRRPVRSSIGRLARFVLGYQTPPPPRRAPSPPQPAPGPRPPLRSRIGGLPRLLLGYQPPPTRSRRRSVNGTKGAWRPPEQVTRALSAQVGGGDRNGGRQPAVAAAVRSTVPVASVAASGLTNGRKNGRSNGSAPSGGGKRRVLSFARLIQLTLGYQPPPGASRPRVSLGARVGRVMQFVLGYEPPPRPVRAPRPPRRPLAPLANLVRLTVGGALTSWVRHFRIAAPALGSITLLLLLGGMLTVSGFAVRTLLGIESSEASVLHVYLAEGASSDQADQMKQDLARMPHVRSVRFVDKEQALAQARDRPGLTDLASLSDSNPFPASFEVEADQPGSVGGLARAVATESGVDQKHPTSYDADTYGRLRQFTLIAAGVAGGFALVLFFITYAISSNSIRTVVLARRDELLTMQLVGASPWLIRTRLGVEGALTGLLAGLIAALLVVGACVGAYYGAQHLFVEVLPGVTAVTAAEVVGAVAIVGLGIGAVSALFAFRRLRT